MSDEQTQQTDEQPESTPAGSYRIPGQDVSGFLGVDPEYMNSSDHTGEAMLTEEERYLFTVPDESDEDEVEAGDEEKASESQDLRDGDTATEHDDDEEKSTYVEPTGEVVEDDSAKTDGEPERAKRPAL